MKHRILAAADKVAHVLYRPTMSNRRVVEVRWHHRFHLIPGWALKVICDRYEAAVWAGFDEPKHTGWTCQHVTITSGIPVTAPSCGNGCTMQRYYPMTSSGTVWSVQ